MIYIETTREREDLAISHTWDDDGRSFYEYRFREKPTLGSTCNVDNPTTHENFSQSGQDRPFPEGPIRFGSSFRQRAGDLSDFRCSYIVGLDDKCYIVPEDPSHPPRLLPGKPEPPNFIPPVRRAPLPPSPTPPPLAKDNIPGTSHLEHTDWPVSKKILAYLFRLCKRKPAKPSQTEVNEFTIIPSTISRQPTYYLCSYNSNGPPVKEPPREPDASYSQRLS